MSYLPDITLFNGLLVLAAGGCWFVAAAYVQEAYTGQATQQPARAGRWAVVAAGLLLGCFLGRAGFENTRRRHWLRAGTSRYSAAMVIRTFYSRSGRKFNFSYQVGAYQGRGQGECGAECPALGARRYGRFAAEAPDVCKLTLQQVPDSVQIVPPLGWARLPPAS